MKWTLRDWVYVAVFGALWGAVEISLGSYLHILFPPLTNTFLNGLVLTFIGVAIALIGRRFVPHRGAVLMIGVVTALLKLLSLGGVKVGPIVAILTESALMEVALLAGREPGPMGCILAGALAFAWNAVHPFIMSPLLFGQNIGQVYGRLVKDGAATLGLSVRQGILVLLMLLLIRLAVGGVAGGFAWSLGEAVRRRAGK